MAVEKVERVLEVKVPFEDIQATFEQNPSLKQAFDALWKEGNFDTWHKRTVRPMLNHLSKQQRFSEEQIAEMTLKRIMTRALERSMRMLVMEHGKGNLIQILEKVLKEETAELIENTKADFDKTVNQYRGMLIIF